MSSRINELVKLYTKPKMEESDELKELRAEKAKRDKKKALKKKADEFRERKLKEKAVSALKTGVEEGDKRKKALEAISERLKTATGKARVAKAIKKYAEQKRVEKAKEEENKLKPRNPLVSKQQYKLNLQMAILAYRNQLEEGRNSSGEGVRRKEKLPKVADRPLYNSIKENIFPSKIQRGRWLSGGGGYEYEVAQSFLNGLTDIYNKRMEGEKQLTWIDWFDASKTDQANGRMWIERDEVGWDALGYFFNIYGDKKGNPLKGMSKHDYGIFYGYSK